MEKVRCNDCDIVWTKEDLIQVIDEKTGDIFTACPVCKKDDYLIDIEVSE